ncbi:MAG: phosphate ABC transporter permease PstA [Bacillota bacterium]
MRAELAVRRAARKRVDAFFRAVFLVAIAVAILVLLILLVNIFSQGIKWIRPEFFTSYASRFYQKAGILAPLVGSFYVILLTAAFALPIGVATAVYLEFYARDSWLTRLLQVNIANLAGVPSIVYGLFGLAFFVRYLAFDRSILSAALTMALLILPVVIVNTREAIKAVPPSLAHAAYALGASRWQVVSTVILPAAVGGILTGTILAVSRALGETAPLITVGAWVFITSLPVSPMDSFTVLPIQIWYWSAQPQQGFREIAAATIIVLLVVLLTMNGVAIFLRNRFQKKAEW